MDKVKKIFSPGSSKDDEVLYGDQATQPTAAGSAGQASGSEYVPEKKEHNVVRQILNPNGANYDEVAYGKPEESQHNPPQTTLEPVMLQTLPESEKKEHGVLRQILNPHGDKYDEQAFGTTAVAAEDLPEEPGKLQTLPEAQKNEHGVLRQIFNPSGDKYDEQAFGTTAVATGVVGQDQPSTIQNDNVTQGTGALSGTAPSRANANDDQSAISIKSGIAGPYAHDANKLSAGAQPGGTTTQQGETATSAAGAHFGRDGTLAGAGLASGETASQLDSNAQGPWSKPNMAADVPAQTAGVLPTDGTTYEDRFRPAGTNIAENPQVNRAPDDVVGATYTARSYKLADNGTGTGVGPTSEMPHVPGEFPLETGEDPHGSHIGPATVAARTAAAEPGAAGFVSTGSQSLTTSDKSTTTTTNTAAPTAPSTQQHYSRDAAVAGAVTAAGAGGYALSQKRDEPTTSSTAPAATYASVDSTGGVGGQTAQTPSTQPVSNATQSQYVPGNASRDTPATGGNVGSYTEPTPTQTTTEHHYGRDAAVAGGVGAAGAGIYEAAKGHDDTGPATKTAGPHESNVANVVDPRVQPDPSQFEDKYAEKAQEKDAKKQEKEAEKEAKKQEKAHEKEVKAQEKEAKKQEKAHEKEVKAQEKEAKKQEKAHEKEAKEQEKAHQKELEAQEKARAKEAKREEKDETHYGRDAAIVGGAGAAGTGAYELSQQRDDTGPAPKTIGPHDSDAANVLDPRVQPDPEKMKDSTTSGPHRSDIANQVDPRVQSDSSTAQQTQDATYRQGVSSGDAAGVSGAAGSDGFEASGIERRDTGPASKTIGPHKSNILNVLDPRVKPDSELMKEEQRITSGPHRSDIANMLDPRVKSSSNQSEQLGGSQQHTGRDAALGAGAGAGIGAAAYGAEREQSEHSSSKLDNSTDDKPKHNKLHKPRPEESSEKQGFFSKILHPGRKSTEDRGSSEGAEDTSIARPSEQQTYPAASATGASGGYAGTQEGTSQSGISSDEVRIEPHTGLPMNVGKYGTYGAGGTDGAPQISGYHETDPAIRDATIGTAQGADKGEGRRPGEEGVAGPDWDAVKKQNTLY